MKYFLMVLLYITVPVTAVIQNIADVSDNHATGVTPVQSDMDGDTIIWSF